MAFIVIEGLDGAGKSTQLGLLRERFERGRIEHRFVHFPRTSSPVFGDMVARFLRGDLGQLDQVDPYLVALLYAGDRNDFKSQLQEWIDAGYAVLMDRYVYSNVAFQCAKMDNDRERQELAEWIEKTEYGYFGLPRPDVSIFLDVPIAFTRQKLKEARTGAEREYLKGKEDIHEKDMGFQEKVREVYLKLCTDKGDIYRVDCSAGESGILPQGEIAQYINEVIEKEGIIQTNV